MYYLSLYRGIYKSRHSVCLFRYLSLSWRRRLLLYVYLLATFLPVLWWVSVLRTEQLAPSHSLENVLTLFLTSDPIVPGSLLLNRSQLKPVSLGSQGIKMGKFLSSFSVCSLNGRQGVIHGADLPHVWDTRDWDWPQFDPKLFLPWAPRLVWEEKRPFLTEQYWYLGQRRKSCGCWERCQP